MKINQDYLVKFSKGTAKVRLIKEPRRNGFSILNLKTVFKHEGKTLIHKGSKVFLAGDDADEASIDAHRWLTWNFEQYKLQECA